MPESILGQINTLETPFQERGNSLRQGDARLSYRSFYRLPSAPSARADFETALKRYGPANDAFASRMLYNSGCIL